MNEHKLGTREEWRAAREELLEREKELTQLVQGPQFIAARESLSRSCFARKAAAAAPAPP
jgi:predicted dithiol-disulfide oxidoreductase (DUF899 family)